MDNSIANVKINLQFNYDNFYELVHYAIADSITVDGRKIAKDPPAVDRLETELAERDFEIQRLKKQIEILEGQRNDKQN